MAGKHRSWAGHQGANSRAYAFPEPPMVFKLLLTTWDSFQLEALRAEYATMTARNVKLEQFTAPSAMSMMRIQTELCPSKTHTLMP